MCIWMYTCIARYNGRIKIRLQQQQQQQQRAPSTISSIMVVDWLAMIIWYREYKWFACASPAVRHLMFSYNFHWRRCRSRATHRQLSSTFSNDCGRTPAVGAQSALRVLIKIRLPRQGQRWVAGSSRMVWIYMRTRLYANNYRIIFLHRFPCASINYGLVHALN